MPQVGRGQLADWIRHTRLRLLTAMHFLMEMVCRLRTLVTNGVQSAGRVLRGLVEKYKYMSGPARPDATRPRDAFDQLISLQPLVRLTNGLL